MSDQPDAASMDRDWGHLDKVWSKAQEHWRELDSYYWRTFEVWSSKKKGERGRPFYHPARPASIVDHAVNTLLAYKPHVTVYPLKEGVTIHEDRADAKEAFLQAVLEETALKSSVLTWKQLSKHMVHYGYGVLEGPIADVLSRPKLPDDPTEEEREIWEAQMLGWNPFQFDAIHPARVKMDPREKKPSLAVKRYKQYAHVLEEITGRRQRRGLIDYTWQGRDNPYALIQVTEWWDEEWHALSAEGGGLLFAEKNVYGFVPFAHAFAGGGMEVTDLAEFDPIYWCKGILTPVIDSLKAEAQQASARHNAVLNRAFARLASKDPEATAQALEEDGVIPVTETEWLQYPDLTAAMFSAAQDVAKDIEEGTYSRVVSGQVSTETVGELAMRTSAALRNFEAPAKQVEEIATVGGGRVFMLMDRLEELEHLTIQGHRLTKEQIDHTYACKVTFDLVDPVIQMQMRELGLREVESGNKSRLTYWETDLRLEDAARERERLDQERLREHPYYQAMAMAHVARIDGMGELADKFEAEAKGLRAQLLMGETIGSDDMSLNGGGNGNIPLAPQGAASATRPQVGTPGAAMTALRQLRRPLNGQTAKPKPRRR